jgi:galactose mutarotase-like enzyme
VLSSAEIAVTVVVGAGMVVSSLRHRGDELLDPRGGVARFAATGSTMGIPLLHPWANRLSGFTYTAAGRRVTLPSDASLLHLDENGLPLHGLVPSRSHWIVERSAADDTQALLAARLDFSPDAAALAAFPFPHVLRLTFAVSTTTLAVMATLTPASDVPVPVSFGFHPYLRLPGVPREEWVVALPVGRRLELDARQLPTGASSPVRLAPGALGARAFDDAFTDLDTPARFTLSGGGRTIAVTFLEGFPMTQVFAPAGRSFVCFEPMTAPTNALVTGGAALPVVHPGATFRAAFSVHLG